MRREGFAVLGLGLLDAGARLKMPSSKFSNGWTRWRAKRNLCGF
jgi:hypothetical protein